jgi:hypothetical protein
MRRSEEDHAELGYLNDRLLTVLGQPQINLSASFSTEIKGEH